MKCVRILGCVLSLVISTTPAAADLFAGKFTTEENGEYAVLTLVPVGSGYTGSILLDGYSTTITAKRHATDLRGKMIERDGVAHPFEARITGPYLIMEFDDGAMIVFRRDQDN